MLKPKPDRLDFALADGDPCAGFPSAAVVAREDFRPANFPVGGRFVGLGSGLAPSLVLGGGRFAVYLAGLDLAGAIEGAG